MLLGIVKGCDPDFWTVNDILLERLGKRHSVLEISDPFDLPDQVPDSFLLRSRNRDLVWMAGLLESQGSRAVNPLLGFEISANKHLTHLAWRGIRQPPWVLQTKAQRRLFGDAWVGKTIQKPLRGAGGKGIRIYPSFDKAPLVPETILQPYIEGAVWRVIVSSEGCVSAYQKDTKEEIANVSTGASRLRKKAPQELQSICQQMIEALGLGISGLDFIENREGFWALESNANFDFAEDDQAVFEAIEREMLQTK